MTTSILFIVVVFFSIRGFFLGFSGVVARLMGVILGYMIAFSYRQPLATFLSENTSSNLSPIILQVITGAALFFATLFIAGLLITTLFNLAAKLIPVLQNLLQQQSPGSRVFGAGINGLIGASLVLIALWGYGLMTNSNDKPDPLQGIANRFGDTLLSYANQLISHNQQATAVNTKISETQTHTLLQQLISSGQLKELLSKDAAKTDMLQELINHPEQVLNNPEIQNLLDSAKQPPTASSDEH